jgi:cytochrome P450
MNARFTPPHVPPVANAIGGIGAIRASLKSTIGNWPVEIYQEDFYRPRTPKLLYVMQEAAIGRVLIDETAKFPMAPGTRNILRPIWRNGIAASDIVFGTLIDGDEADPDHKDFQHTSRQLVERLENFNLADVLQLPVWVRPLFGSTANKSAKRLHEIVDSMLERKGKGKAERSNSLLARLRSASDPETGATMNAGLVRDNIVGSLAAGRETTALSAAWALWLIAQSKEAAERVAGELDTLAQTGPACDADLDALPYLKAVVLEAMRLFPPATQLLRRCVTTTDLGGAIARRGDLIIIPVYALHRRTDFWDAPDRFDPERFLPDRFDPRAARFRYLPFGLGPRICIGMHFAMIEIMAMLATLLQQGRVTAVADEPEIELRSGFTLRSKHGLWVNYQRPGSTHLATPANTEYEANALTPIARTEPGMGP